MLIFPVFPDDMLCMVAGLTTMSYGYFIIVVLLTRPWGLAATCYFGSGQIIPFHGWGLWIWAGIFLFIAVAFFLITKFKPQLTEFFQGLGKKGKPADKKSEKAARRKTKAGE